MRVIAETWLRSGIAAAVLRAAAAAALRPDETRVITFKDLLKVCRSVVCLFQDFNCSSDFADSKQGGEEQDRVGNSEVMEVMQRMVT
jgi:hypothetical protein